MANKPISMDYDQHVREQEGMMENLMVTRGVTCSIGLHKGMPGQANPMVFECGHCLRQDEVHPEKVYRMPKGYFICATCLNLLERKKLKFVQAMRSQCEGCVKMELDRIVAMDPTLFVDYYKPDEAQGIITKA